MNKRLNRVAQGGFTLIELIVVIVVLGILAATALPKFTSMGGDARAATLRAAAGSLASVATTVHGKYLADESQSTFTLEGTDVALSNGYPAADSEDHATATMTAAGLAKDYALIKPGTGLSATTPLTGAKQFAIVPASLAGSAAAVKCNILYTEAASKTSPPQITIPDTMTADNCQ